jgi:hypothetical protein
MKLERRYRLLLLVVAWLAIGSGAMTAYAAGKGPVKVFILSGQSNMEGKAAVSTLDAVIDDPKTHDQFKHLKPGGKWLVRDDVWVTYLCRQPSRGSDEIPNHGKLTVGFGSHKTDKKDRTHPKRTIGPELGIGEVLGDQYDEPVLLIKAAWGGKSVKHNFLPPGAMPSEEEIKAKYAAIQKVYEERKKSLEEQKAKDPNRKQKTLNPPPSYEDYKNSIGLYYRKLLEECGKVLGDIKKYVPDYDEKQGYEIAGFIWFQGWNDGIGAGNPDYVEQMAHFIRDIRKDLKTPKLPVVIGELGTDGPEAEGWVATFRKQQADIAALPEFKGNVRLAKTAHCWHKGPYDMSSKWEEFQKLGKANAAKPADDPTRIDPGKFFQANWVQKYAKELAYTSDKRYHYNGSGRSYYEMGQSMGKAMLEMLK